MIKSLMDWGIHCLQAGNLQGALHSFEQALWLDANYAEGYLFLGLAQQQSGDRQSAQQSFTKAIALNPQDARFYFYRGELYRQQQAYHQAIADYRQAIALKPDWSEPYSPLGELLFQMGNFPELIPILEALDRAGAGSDTLYFQLGVAYRCTNQIDLAKQNLERVAHLPSARLELKEIYRQKVMDWHFWMMNDAVRNQAYDLALQELVTPASTVLDIGTGSGLLAMQSARAGAKQVFTCEMEPIIAEMAEKIIMRNGYRQVIKVITGDSNLLQIPQDIPERADILVTETFGAWLPAEGALQTIYHARQHLLKPEAKIIPCAGVMYVVLLEAAELHGRYFAGYSSGFDLSWFNHISPYADYKFIGQIGQHEYRLLTEPVPLPRLDFYHAPPQLPELHLELEITNSGTIHGICSWFDLWLSDRHMITTHPDRSLAHNAPSYGQWVQLLEEPLTVEAGDTKELKVTPDGCSLV